MSALHKTKVWLGLADEDELEQEVSAENEPKPRPAREEPTPSVTPTATTGADVTPLPRNRRVARAVPDPQEEPVRRITTIHPKNYNDAKTIGENFREGVPVILNLSDLDDADAKRLVDFSAGLIFGLRGKIERVTAKVFLLSPSTVEVTTEQAEGSPTDTSASSSLFASS